MTAKIRHRMVGLDFTVDVPRCTGRTVYYNSGPSHMLGETGFWKWLDPVTYGAMAVSRKSKSSGKTRVNSAYSCSWEPRSSERSSSYAPNFWRLRSSGLAHWVLRLRSAAARCSSAVDGTDATAAAAAHVSSSSNIIHHSPWQCSSSANAKNGPVDWLTSDWHICVISPAHSHTCISQMCERAAIKLR